MTPQPSFPRFVTTRAAARQLDLAERTIRHYCQTGKLAGAWQPSGYSGTWLIPRRVILEVAADLAETTPTLENGSTLRGMPTIGETPMQTTDQITAQIARYGHKLNTLEHQEAQHRQELAYLDKEEARVRILIELGEATPDDLDDLKARRSNVLQQLAELGEQLELARSAHAELHDRLEASQIEDERALRISHLEAYRDAAQSILAQLDSINQSYDELRDLARQLHPDARHFQAISSAGTRATSDWPKYLQHDIRRVNAALEHLQADEAVGA